MPFLQLRDSRYPLHAGENRVGWGPDVDVRLPDPDLGLVTAVVVVSVSEGGAASVAPRTVPHVVALNGVAVHDPAPLLHGDHLDVAGVQLRYGDEAQLGETVEIPPSDVAIAVPSASARASCAGGRLLSLVDGREYPVSAAGLTIGRDPSSDIVVAAAHVSRKHAVVRPSGSGYILLDTSANGVFVNDARVRAEVPLGRGDMIRVGQEEFRFHAEEAAPREAGPHVPALQVTGTFAAARRPTPPVGGQSVTPDHHADRPKGRPSLGVLEVINEGPTRGTKYQLDSPRLHVGRGDHNDVAIPDESVSDSHARLQRREGTWYLFDLESTNGTYVGGTRISDEVALFPGAEVRFGRVKMAFRPMGGVARPSGETRVIVGVKAPDPKRAEPRDRVPPVSDGNSPDGSPSRTSPLLWVLVIVLVILALFMVIQGWGR